MKTIADLPEDARELLSYWKAERNTGRIPHVSSIDPLKLRQWIGDLSVMDVHEGSKNFYIRLHGTITAENIGQDFSKQYLEDCAPAHARDLATYPYTEAIAHLAPTFSVVVPGVVTGVFNTFERLVLPFTEDNESDLPVVTKFLIWVGPTELSIFESSTVYGDDDSGTTQDSSTRIAMELVVIDVDDPRYDPDRPIQDNAPSAAETPVAKLICIK